MWINFVMLIKVMVLSVYRRPIVALRIYDAGIRGSLLQMLSSLSLGIGVASYKFMCYMAKCRRDSASGALLDAGTDLNMEKGIAECVANSFIRSPPGLGSTHSGNGIDK